MELIIGGPGCGKTRHMIDTCMRLLDQGASPHEIAFVSFTNAAVNEARARMQKAQAGEYPWFRTIHSLAFRQIGASRSAILQREHLDELAALTGEEFTGRRVDDDGPLPSEVTGDHLMHLEQLARATESGISKPWLSHASSIDWYRFKRFVDTYQAFKQQRALIDFTDLLERYAADGQPAPVRHAIIDEAQDLTALQWRCVERAFAGSSVHIGGDDDQCIHAWAGAADAHFRNLPATPFVLGHSHRLPRNIHRLALKVIGQVRQRYQKHFTPADRDGRVIHLFQLSQAPLEHGKWLLLARSRWLCNQLARECRERGLLYSLGGRSSVDPKDLELIQAHGEANWHETLTEIPAARREYYLAARRKGERLLGKPRLRIETIHGAKGLEADNVLLLADLPRRAELAMLADPDAEARVWYVGVTRASENLYIVEAQDGRGYPI